MLKGENMSKRRIVKLFESRSGNLENRLKKDYIQNGVATIPCRVSDYNDVISNYSVKGFETLNQEFVDFLKRTDEVIPPDYPVVLNIISDTLSAEEKKAIKETIEDHFAYELGVVENHEKRHTRTFILMLIGMVLSGILLWLTRTLEEESRELFFVLFWFLGDTLCDYIFLTGHDLRHDRRLAGRLASVKIVFSDEFEKPKYTDTNREKLYSEIEKDVEETIKD
ncbi:MAG: hypothetical protein IKO23_09070 [Bacteroidales bacterium]|nr:hypothetical protein [Bacteroidales bacterium]